IVTKNTDPKSFYASSDIVIGKDDNCAEGGDVQMVTLGGVEFAAKVNIYGSQILAAGDISMTANADGIEGVALVSGGKLDVTSNGAFGFCDGDGMNNNYAAAYFRVARGDPASRPRRGPWASPDGNSAPARPVAQPAGFLHPRPSSDTFCRGKARQARLGVEICCPGRFTARGAGRSANG